MLPSGRTASIPRQSAGGAIAQRAVTPPALVEGSRRSSPCPDWPATEQPLPPGPRRRGLQRSCRLPAIRTFSAGQMPRSAAIRSSNGTSGAGRRHHPPADQPRCRRRAGRCRHGPRRRPARWLPPHRHCGARRPVRHGRGCGSGSFQIGGGQRARDAFKAARQRLVSGI